MKALIAKISYRLHALSERERWLFLGSLLVLIFVVIDNLVLQPSFSHQKELSSNIVNAKQQLQKTAEHLMTTQELAKANNPLVLKKKKLTLERNLAKMEQDYQTQRHQTPSPAEMANEIKNTLATIPGLKFLHMRTLLPKQIALKQSGKILYQHSLEITFTGSFSATLKYLQTLESLGLNFYWTDFDLDTKADSPTEISLTVSTLSSRKVWYDL